MSLVILLSLLKLATMIFTANAVKYLANHEIANEFQIFASRGLSVQHSAGYEILNIFPLLISNDEIVTVTFRSSNPQTADVIAAYAPGALDITTTTPVKFGYCSADAKYLYTGRGSLTFNFTNLRSNISFYYFSGGLHNPILRAVSNTSVSFLNLNEPLRPRVVATGNTDVLKLIWSSATSEIPLLRWGLESHIYPFVSYATTSRIKKWQMCGAPANSTGWRDLGLIHRALFTGMDGLSGRRIYYIFGDDNTDTFTNEYVLFVPPAVGTVSQYRPTTVILYDDMGRGSNDMSFTWNEYGRPSTNTSMAVAVEVAHGLVDAVYHGGDISYATGYMAVWDFFLNMISPISASVVYLTTVGNHESDWFGSASYYSLHDSGGECGVAATTLLPMPYPASLNEPWWSYDVGLLHLVGVSSEHNYTRGSKQYLWLKNDLESVNRTLTPWIIFGCHRAMYVNSDYSSNPGGDVEAMDLLIEHIEPLLWKNKVNFAFYGHNHVVQRHSAVYKRTVVQASELRQDGEGHTVHWHDDPQATVHVVVGTAGASFTRNAVEPKPAWNELYFYRWGYSRLKAYNATHLGWEWVDSGSAEVVDRLMITQRDPHLPWVLPTASSGRTSSAAAVAVDFIRYAAWVGVVLSASAIIVVLCLQSGKSIRGHAGAEQARPLPPDTDADSVELLSVTASTPRATASSESGHSPTVAEGDAGKALKKGPKFSTTISAGGVGTTYSAVKLTGDDDIEGLSGQD